MREWVREMLQNNYLIFIALGYLAGGVLFSYYIPKCLKHVDVTDSSPDRNPGAFNAIKETGPVVGGICLLCDIAKGYLVISYAVPFLDIRNPWFGLVLLAPVAGHAYSIMRHFSGGKAIAVSFGVLLGLLPLQWHVLILAASYIIFSSMRSIKPNERRSVYAFGVLNLYAVCTWLLGRTPGVCLGIIGMTVIVMQKNWKDARLGEFLQHYLGRK